MSAQHHHFRLHNVVEQESRADSHRRWFGVLLALGWSLFPGWASVRGAEAETPPPTVAYETSKAESSFPEWPRYSIVGGGYLVGFDSSLGLAVRQGIGVEIDAEELLGLESSQVVYRLEGEVNLGSSRRHNISVSYSSYNRSANAILGQDIEIGDEVVFAGAELDTVFDFDIFQVSYAYAFFQDDRMRLAGGLGFYVAPLKYGVTIIEDTGDRELVLEEVTVPLPVIGLNGTFRVTSRLSLLIDANLMYLQVGDFEGSLVDFTLAAEYRVCRNFAIGLGGNAFDVAVSAPVDEEADYFDFSGDVDLHLSGLLLYGRIQF